MSGFKNLRIIKNQTHLKKAKPNIIVIPITQQNIDAVTEYMNKAVCCINTNPSLIMETAEIYYDFRSRIKPEKTNDPYGNTEKYNSHTYKRPSSIYEMLCDEIKAQSDKHKKVNPSLEKDEIYDGYQNGDLTLAKINLSPFDPSHYEPFNCAVIYPADNKAVLLNAIRYMYSEAAVNMDCEAAQKLLKKMERDYINNFVDIETRLFTSYEKIRADLLPSFTKSPEPQFPVTVYIAQHKLPYIYPEIQSQKKNTTNNNKETIPDNEVPELPETDWKEDQKVWQPDIEYWIKRKYHDYWKNMNINLKIRKDEYQIYDRRPFLYHEEDLEVWDPVQRQWVKKENYLDRGDPDGIEEKYWTTEYVLERYSGNTMPLELGVPNIRKYSLESVEGDKNREIYKQRFEFYNADPKDPGEEHPLLRRINVSDWKVAAGFQNEKLQKKRDALNEKFNFEILGYIDDERKAKKNRKKRQKKGSYEFEKVIVSGYAGNDFPYKETYQDLLKEEEADKYEKVVISGYLEDNFSSVNIKKDDSSFVSGCIKYIFFDSALTLNAKTKKEFKRQRKEAISRRIVYLKLRDLLY